MAREANSPAPIPTRPNTNSPTEMQLWCQQVAERINYILQKLQ